MRRIVLPLSLAVVAIVAVVGVTALVSTMNGGGDVTAETGSEQKGVMVTGEGLVRVRPDTGFLDLGVQATASTVAAAVQDAGASMQAVIDSLKANGLADDDIQTTAFSIQPQYDYQDGTPRLRGYTVVNSVNARIKADPATVGERMGKIIDDAAAAGGDRLIIQGISFTVADQSAAVTSARKAAVENARAKAEELAANAGVPLGKALLISETSSTPSPSYRPGAEAPTDDSKTPIQAGLLTVSVSVSITYAID